MPTQLMTCGTEPVSLYGAASIRAGWAYAYQHEEPVLIVLRPHVDASGRALMNQFQDVPSVQGQVHDSVLSPGTIQAWQRYRHHFSMWLCLRGHIKLAVHRETDGACWTVIMGDKRPRMALIPPSLWHGIATVGPEPAGLLHHALSQCGGSASGEEHRPHDAVPEVTWHEDLWQVQHH